MRSRWTQSEFNGIALAISIPLSLLLFVSDLFGPALVAILLLVAVMAICGFVIYGVVTARRARETKLRQPCEHRVPYAKHSPDRCNDCVALELKRQENERQRQAEEELRMRHEQARRDKVLRENLRRKTFLKQMDPLAFERTVCDLYARMGYEVRPTPQTADGGADGFLQKNGVKYVLQCKRVQGSVGQPILRDLLGTMMHFECQEGIVVTTGSVSTAARNWAKGKPIQIVEIDELQSLFEKFFRREVTKDGKSANDTFWTDPEGKIMNDQAIDAAIDSFDASLCPDAQMKRLPETNRNNYDAGIEEAIKLFEDCLKETPAARARENFGTGIR